MGITAVVVTVSVSMSVSMSMSMTSVVMVGMMVMMGMAVISNMSMSMTVIVMMSTVMMSMIVTVTVSMSVTMMVMVGMMMVMRWHVVIVMPSVIVDLVMREELNGTVPFGTRITSWNVTNWFRSTDGEWIRSPCCTNAIGTMCSVASNSLESIVTFQLTIPLGLFPVAGVVMSVAVMMVVSSMSMTVSMTVSMTMSMTVTAVITIFAFASVMLKFNLCSGSSGFGTDPVSFDVIFLFVLWMSVHAVVLVFDTSSKRTGPLAVITSGHLFGPDFGSVSFATDKCNFGRTTINNDSP
jgi:hypothetical protein